MLDRHGDLESDHAMSAEFATCAYVYTTIKDLMVEEALPPGAHIDLEEMATELKVDRTPVWEALLRLSNEEFVDVLPAAGFVVRSRSVKDLQADYEYAFMILKYSIEKNITGFTLEGLRRPTPAVTRVDEKFAASTNTMFLEGLYDRIASLSENANALKAIRSFNSRTTRHREQNLLHPSRGPKIAAAARELASTLQSHHVDDAVAKLGKLFNLANICLEEMTHDQENLSSPAGLASQIGLAVL